MFTTDNQQAMRDMLKLFCSANREFYGDHAYTAGYYESMIVQMLPYLPKRVQKDFIEDVRRGHLRTQIRAMEAREVERAE